jgi:exosome complex component RRP42
MGTMEVELDEDPLACTRFSVENMPVFVSLARIGAHFVVDTTIEEELVMDVRLLVGVNRHGDFFTLEKGGFAGLEPTSVFCLLSVGSFLCVFLLCLYYVYGCIGCDVCVMCVCVVCV